MNNCKKGDVRMKEIEILVEVYDEPSKIIEKLDNFEFKGVKETIDVYYYDPKRDNLKPNKNMQIDECLRIRTKNNEHYITYKVDKFDEDGKWLYSDEYETKFEDIFMLNNIINKLGLKELLIIQNSKRTYINDKYEIVLETVKDLGYFLEVEYCTNEDVDVKEVKKEIQQFIDSLELNVSEELNMGKPEMMIRKNNILV
jgi:predicted adenylyl cyclase CyaB